MRIKKELLIKIVCLAFWIALWQIIAMAVGKELLVATPVAVVKVLAVKITESAFWISIFYSMARVILGFVLAVIIGVILAILTSAVPLLHHLFYPLLTVIKATPVASFIILTLLWIKSAGVPIFMAILMVMPIVWGNITTAIKNTDKNLLQMANVYNFGRFKTIRLIYVPQCIPNFYTSCVMGIGFAWKAAIAAEVISSPKLSIGREIYNSKIYFETADLFAWTIVVILLSLVVEKIFKRIMVKAFKIRAVKK